MRRDSAFESFIGLRGASWAYNEPRSHSGFNVVRAYLAELGERESFFGRGVEAGAHSNSFANNLVRRRRRRGHRQHGVGMARSQRNDLADEIRVIDTIGPSPIPPWVISR